MVEQRVLDLTTPKAAEELAEFLHRGASFSVAVLKPDGLEHTFVMEREHQQGKRTPRWHAYRRIGQREFIYYAGTDKSMTLERLRSIAERYNALLTYLPHP